MNSTFPGITSTITKEMNPIYHCILWSWIHRKETAALFHAAQNPMQSQQNAGFEGRKIEFQSLDNNEFKSTFFPHITMVWSYPLGKDRKIVFLTDKLYRHIFICRTGITQKTRFRHASPHPPPLKHPLSVIWPKEHEISSTENSTKSILSCLFPAWLTELWQLPLN